MCHFVTIKIYLINFENFFLLIPLDKFTLIFKKILKTYNRFKKVEIGLNRPKMVKIGRKIMKKPKIGSKKVKIGSK